MTDRLIEDDQFREPTKMARPGDRDDRPVWQKLESRAQVPLHQAALALANILGDSHPLYLEAQELRGKVNQEIASRRGAVTK